jgi:hypothetical protein
MKKPKIVCLSNRLGVSYAISAVIIAITTINRVLVASSYAISGGLRAAAYLPMFCFGISRKWERGGSAN